MRLDVSKYVMDDQFENKYFAIYKICKTHKLQSYNELTKAK